MLKQRQANQHAYLDYPWPQYLEVVQELYMQFQIGLVPQNPSVENISQISASVIYRL